MEGVLQSSGVASQVNVAVAVPNVDPAVFKPGDVRVGAKVNALFISIFILGATGAGQGPGSINWYISKLHDGQTGPTPGQTGTSKIRNQIFHEEKGLAGSQDGTPMAFKGVIVVPRGMRRMREGDVIQISLAQSASSTADNNFCLKAIFKSFY